MVSYAPILPIVRLHLKKKKKKKKKGKEGPDVSSILSASCEQVKAGVCKEGEPVWGLSPELLSWGAWLLEYPWTNTAVAKTILFDFVLCFYEEYLLERGKGSYTPGPHINLQPEG